MRTSSLGLLKLTSFIRSLRFLPPLFAAGVILVILYASTGQASASGFADSAALLFPVYAWTSRQLLDTDPDEQEQLGAVALGGRAASVATGVATAALSCCFVLAVAIAWPLARGAFSPTPSAGEMALRR